MGRGQPGSRMGRLLRWIRPVLALAVALWLAEAFALWGFVASAPVAPEAPVRPAPWPRGQALPRFSHIFLILMENRAPSQTFTGLQTPYLQALARRYSVETNDWGVRHPSLPNYIALTSGSTQGIRTDCAACYVNAPNLASEFAGRNVSWDAFLEGLPRAGSLTAVNWPTLYAGKHDPFRYYRNVRTQRALRSHLLPLADLWPRLKRADGVPRFIWITPNLCHDMHSCPAIVGDLWLRLVLPRILSSSAYRNGGVVFITWDEGNASPPGAPGQGGRVPLMAISPSSRRGGRLGLPVTHEALLHTIETVLNVPCLGKSCEAPTLGGLFVRHSP